jgi:hypothetical protein
LLEICSSFAVFHVFRGFTPLFSLWKDLGGHIGGRPQLV